MIVKYMFRLTGFKKKQVSESNQNVVNYRDRRRINKRSTLLNLFFSIN